MENNSAMAVMPAVTMIAPVQMNPALMVQELKTRKAVIFAVMKDLMKEGEHYGVIPGTDRKSLHKSGAELFTSVFLIAPKYIVNVADLGNGHREYTITCELYSQDSGKFLGQGMGSCTTLEKKYRYRTVKQYQAELPEGYWDNKDQFNKHFRAQGLTAAKDDDTGKWALFSFIKAENPDLADVYNTCLKMAKKRALVDATLTVTGISDIFSQDAEDFTDTSSGSWNSGQDEGQDDDTGQKAFGKKKPDGNSGKKKPGTATEGIEDIPDEEKIRQQNNKTVLGMVTAAVQKAKAKNNFENLQKVTLIKVNDYYSKKQIDEATMKQCDTLISTAVSEIALQIMQTGKDTAPAAVTVTEEKPEHPVDSKKPEIIF